MKTNRMSQTSLRMPGKGTRTTFTSALAVIALCGVAISGTSCMTPGMQKMSDLKMTTREHNSDVRWARYQTAAANFIPAEGRRFLKRVALVEGDLVMADQEVTSIEMADDDTAVATVTVQWYLQRDPVVRTAIIEQVWVHQGEWHIKSERRVRGERFPLVAEKVKPEDVEGAKPEGDKAEGAEPEGDKAEDVTATTKPE